MPKLIPDIAPESLKSNLKILVSKTANNLKQADEPEKNESVNYFIAPEIIYGSVQLVNNCMYSIAGKSNRQMSNFKISIHYFLSSDTNSERVVEICNESGENEIFNTDATIFSKKESFSKMVEGKGNYIYSGNNNDFLELKIFLFKNEKKAFKIPYLGYNSKENFYVFCNCIIDESGKVKRVNNDGLIKVKDKIFHFDTFRHFNEHSKSNIQQSDADENNAEMKFIYKESTISANDYFKQFVKVFQDKGAIGLFFSIASFYRDVLFKELGCFPHLYLIGKPASGKTTFRKGVLSFFGNEQNAIMLGTGSTQKAGLRRLAQFSNALVTFDEYKNDIDAKYIELFKGAFDGEGYERAAKTMDNKTFSTSPRSALIIGGQEMPTKENALFSRGLLINFFKTEFESNEKIEFEKLDKMQKAGLSNFVCELMKHRDLIKKEFRQAYEKCYIDISTMFEGGAIIERILKNYAAIVTPYYILHRKSLLNISGIENIFDFIKGLIEQQTDVLKESNEINIFWGIVKTLINNGVLVVKTDYVFHTVEGVQCICIKSGYVYPKYNTYCINQRIKALDKYTLFSYLKSEKCYIHGTMNGGVRLIKDAGIPTAYLCFNTALIDVKFGIND